MRVNWRGRGFIARATFSERTPVSLPRAPACPLVLLRMQLSLFVFALRFGTDGIVVGQKTACAVSPFSFRSSLSLRSEVDTFAIALPQSPVSLAALPSPKLPPSPFPFNRHSTGRSSRQGVSASGKASKHSSFQGKEGHLPIRIPLPSSQCPVFPLPPTTKTPLFCSVYARRAA